MKVGYIKQKTTPHSIANYRDHIINNLKNRNVSFIDIMNSDCGLNDLDLIWDPRAGRGAPNLAYVNSGKPFIATYHGAANVALPLFECFAIKEMLKGRYYKKQTIEAWTNLANRNIKIIAVSKYAQREFLDFSKFNKNDVSVIYHGVEHDKFTPDTEKNVDIPDEKFILHVSSFQPKKNIPRILKSYSKLKKSYEKIPILMIVSPNFESRVLQEGVHIITKSLTHDELKYYYRAAKLFLFPSLHETFGLPILEAMASGCPVVTSNSTACAEIGGHAAVLVDPRSTKNISDAMYKLISDNDYHQEIAGKGLLHAKKFSWEKSAARHFEIFERAINGQ